MNASELVAYEKVDMDDLLPLQKFEEKLQRRDTTEVQDFRSKCREFFDQLVDCNLSHHTVLSYCWRGMTNMFLFCPNILYELLKKVDDCLLSSRKLALRSCCL